MHDCGNNFFCPITVTGRCVDPFKVTKGWIDALGRHDPETREHSERVTELAIKLGIILSLKKGEQEILQIAALGHDLGKFGIRSIIKSAVNFRDHHDLLDLANLEEIKLHPVVGYDILRLIPGMEEVAVAVVQHHENYNGTGYPSGLKGQNICLVARIITICDVYDALVTERPYRPAWEKEKVLEHLNEKSGVKFDPEITSIFLSSVANQNST